jgi:hypothetical protein
MSTRRNDEADRILLTADTSRWIQKHAAAKACFICKDRSREEGFKNLLTSAISSVGKGKSETGLERESTGSPRENAASRGKKGECDVEGCGPN